jgi:uncharacterized protein (TIGR02996 family)
VNLTGLDDHFQRDLSDNPADHGTRLVFADYLEETGRPDEAHRQRLWADFYRRTWPTLAEEHKVANGRRRARIVTLVAVLDCVRAAIDGPDGWHANGGGALAGAFGD